jgi:hypothetical protein
MLTGMGNSSETRHPTSHGTVRKNPAPLLDRLVTSAVSLHGLRFLSFPFITADSFGVVRVCTDRRPLSSSSPGLSLIDILESVRITGSLFNSFKGKEVIDKFKMQTCHAVRSFSCSSNYRNNFDVVAITGDPDKRPVRDL